MTDTLIKTRFAPSPTGLIHLGNVRTALFNALFAWHHQGHFLLRMEDTDAERSRAEYAEQLMTDLHWLGLDWQEGPQIGGAQAPYAQSQRGAIYAAYYQQLEQAGLAYPCFCSPEELSLSRKLQRASGQAPRYAGTCAHLKPAEVEQKRAAGLQPTLRFRVPRGEVIEFDDVVRGPQRFNSDDIGDFIIRRADGSPAFFFCNAVDDSLMGVTHVFRGEDHLTNTPRQLMILRALGLPTPAYGHISMILGDDGSPLSKRHGSLSLKDLREGGWLPAGINNYLARLGHSYPEDDFFSLAQLAERFDVARLGRAPARFDNHQLRHWQQTAALTTPPDALWAWMGEAVRGVVGEAQRDAFIRTVHPNVGFPADALDWARRLCSDDLAVDEEAATEMSQAGKAFFGHALNALVEQGTDWKALANALKQASGKKGKALFMPLRAALTGRTHGPEMARVLPLLGSERARARLQAAQDNASAD